jgi:ubiquinone/menaquinone biosynthesis C-methylase UbiE
MSRETQLQRNYYAETATRYDEMHVSADDEHSVSLSYISAFLQRLGAHTFLDVGCGTGRALEYLKGANPNVTGYGLEPVTEVLRVAANKGIERKRLIRGSVLELPFPDGSFDVVLECGVLHHVKQPAVAVGEMMRVARRAVFLSDDNIFGHGTKIERILKLALYRINLWRFVKLLQTGGKGYAVSDGDGVSYSYSVYFQYNHVREWADRVIAVPVRNDGGSPRWWSPVLASDTVLLCAFRE